MRLPTLLVSSYCFIAILWGLAIAAAQTERLLSRAPDAKMVRDVEAYTRYQQSKLQKRVQKKQADFRFPNAAARPSGPIAFADHSVSFSSNADEDGAYVALHKRHGGAMLAACKMPCEIHLDKSRDYVVSAISSGRQPYIRGYLPRNRPAAKRDYKVYFGTNLMTHMRRAAACYEAHDAANRPDQDAVACARLPPHNAPDRREVRALQDDV